MTLYGLLLDLNLSRYMYYWYFEGYLIWCIPILYSQCRNKYSNCKFLCRYDFLISCNRLLKPQAVWIAGVVRFLIIIGATVIMTWWSKFLKPCTNVLNSSLDYVRFLLDVVDRYRVLLFNFDFSIDFFDKSGPPSQWYKPITYYFGAKVANKHA